MMSLLIILAIGVALTIAGGVLVNRSKRPRWAELGMLVFLIGITLMIMDGIAAVLL